MSVQVSGCMLQAGDCRLVASYPGVEKGEEKRLVHTVCACANINYVMAYSDVAIGGWLSDVRGRTRSKSDLVNVCVHRFTDGLSKQ